MPVRPVLAEVRRVTSARGLARPLDGGAVSPTGQRMRLDDSAEGAGWMLEAHSLQAWAAHMIRIPVKDRRGAVWLAIKPSRGLRKDGMRREEGLTCGGWSPLLRLGSHNVGASPQAFGMSPSSGVGAHG